MDVIRGLDGGAWFRLDTRVGAAGEVPWRDRAPKGRTAVLIPARNEDVDALEERIRTLRADLGETALGGTIDVWVLSDSDDPRIVDREERMAEMLAEDPRSGVAAYSIAGGREMPGASRATSRSGCGAGAAPMRICSPSMPTAA